jgi:hypothetical protein
MRRGPRRPKRYLVALAFRSIPVKCTKRSRAAGSCPVDGMGIQILMVWRYEYLHMELLHKHGHGVAAGELAGKCMDILSELHFA